MKPIISNYLNIYQYLQDYYLYRKNNDTKFSYSRWAAELDIKNKSHVRFIVLGKRPLGQKMIEKLKESFGLDDQEKKIFEVLANYSQSRTEEQKRILGKELIRLLKSPVEQEEVNIHHEMLRNPLTLALRTLLTFRDITLDLHILTQLFCVPQSEISSSIETLKKLGFLQEQKGALVPAQSPHLKFSDKFQDLSLQEFYSHSLHTAQQAINTPISERRFRSWFVAFTQDEFLKFTQEAESRVREKVLESDSEELQDRRLYQVLMTTVPVTQSLQGLES